MILKGFKKKSNEKYLNKLLSKRQIVDNDNTFECLGVILNIDEFEDFESFKKLAKIIGIRSDKLTVVAFSEKEENDITVFKPCFNSNDFGRKGTVNNLELKAFLETDFDALISYYQNDILELKLITAKSKAKFKIGILQTDERLNDLILQTNVKTFNLFKTELVKYLSILNKIK